MLRRNLGGIVVLALFSTITMAAQIKEMPKTPVTPINPPKAVDINSATANDFVNVGTDACTAKKIVDDRPYRSKRDLVTRQILTSDPYAQFSTLFKIQAVVRERKGALRGHPLGGFASFKQTALPPLRGAAQLRRGMSLLQLPS